MSTQFFLAVTKGAVIRVQDNRHGEKQGHLERVHKVTSTQIVTRTRGYGSTPFYETRYQRTTGGERCSSDWYYRKHIVAAVVPAEDIATFEEVEARNEAFAQRRSAIDTLEAACRQKIAARLNAISEDKIKVDAISNDGLATVTYNIKIEGLTADEIACL